MAATPLAPPEHTVLTLDSSSAGAPPTTKPETKLPLQIINYSGFWRDYKKAFENYTAAVAHIQTKEQRFRGKVENYELLTPCPRDKEIEEFHGKIFELLVRDAERKFAVPGSYLKIDRTELRELPCAAIETFNPEELWLHLDSTFNSEAGQTASYLLASQALGEAHELSPYRDRNHNEDKEAKMVGGRLVLTKSIWGEYRYNFRAKEELSKLIAALKCVAIWGGLWNEADQEAFEAILNKIQEERGNDARCLGRMDWWTPVHIISYKEKVELRIDPKLAEQIQIFLSLYPIKRNY